MRRWLRPFWVLLALFFLLEAWLWDHLEPIVERIVNLIRWPGLRKQMARLIDVLPPWAVLFIFVIPFIVMTPLKFLEVYFIATGDWVGAIAVIIFIKVAGLGMAAFIFEVTRDKLLQMAWFRRMYEWFLWARDWAHAQTEPIRHRLRSLRWLLKPQRAGRFLRRVLWLRRRAYRKPA